MTSSIIIVVYINGKIHEDDEGVIFEGSRRAMQINRGCSFDQLESSIRDKFKLNLNEVIGSIVTRYYVKNKFVIVQISDDEDVECMINNYLKQDIGPIELCVKVFVAGGSSSMHNFGSTETNVNMSYEGHHASVVSDSSDADYIVSDSYVDSSTDEEDVDLNLSELDDEETNEENRNLSITLRHDVYGGGQHPFWETTPHYSNVNWDHPDAEDGWRVTVEENWKEGQELSVGLEFDGKKEVQNAVARYLMNVHQTMTVLESKPTKYVVYCPKNSPGTPCPFYMRAIKSKRAERWKVMQWGGPHTCLNPSMTQDHVQLTSHMISTCIVGMIREDPSIKIALVQERIASELNYKISYRKAWLGKQKAMTMIYGDWEESYSELPVWLRYMQIYSPGSFYEIVDEDYYVGDTIIPNYRQFKRVFWTFRQCVEAFNYCKPIIQIDGTHLYGRYRGTLLMATTQDGNGNVLPLAFAVVEGETLSAWSWFLSHLRRHVTDKSGICIISDRHRSIISAIENEANGWSRNQAYHVYCIRHIASNFNHKFKNQKHKQMLVKLGYTPCKHVFDRNFKKFCDQESAIAHWIEGIPKEKWSMAYDNDGRRYGHMTTNLSECINKVFKGCRNLPICALVKSTHGRCREYFVQRGQRAQQELTDGHMYSSKIIQAIKRNQAEANTHIVRVYDIQETRFEVEEAFNHLTQRGGSKWTVKLNDKYCQCGRLSAFHYPCSHVIAVCSYCSIDFFHFVDDVFKNENIMKAYSGEWWPMGNEDAFDPVQQQVKLVPDASNIRCHGRPKSSRIRNEMDWSESSQRRVKCGLCGQNGHNRRNCPSNSNRS